MKSIRTLILLLVLIFSLGCAVASTYSRGDRAIFIGKAQKALIKVECYSGKITNKFDAKTEKAVKLFQAINNLDDTGILDEKTQYKLFSSEATSYSQWIYENHLSTLSSKVKDEDDISYYQNQLEELGYPIIVTGIYDKTTILCTKYIQDYYQMNITGKATKEIREKANSGTLVDYKWLESELSKEAINFGTKHYLSVLLAERQLAELGYLDDSKVDTKYDKYTKQALSMLQQFNWLDYTQYGDNYTLAYLYSDYVQPYSTFDNEKSIKPNSSSSKIKTLQTNLYLLGYYKGKINGSYGDKTKAAVRKFQSKNNLYPSGIAYAQTVERIEETISGEYSRPEIEQVIQIALSKIGCAYKSRGVGPYVFDCCGFTRYCYKKGANISLPDSVYGQAHYSDGIKINDLSKCPRGAILVFKDGTKKYTHVALYLGDYKIVHASSAAKKIVALSIGPGSNSYEYYKKNFMFGVVV